MERVKLGTAGLGIKNIYNGKSLIATFYHHVYTMADWSPVRKRGHSFTAQVVSIQHK